MGQALLTPAGTGSLDRSVADLVAGKERWARLPIAEKAAYLEAVRQRTLVVMDDWVAGARSIAGVPAGSHWAGPEWGAGPWYLLLAVVALQDTLAALERGRAPTPAAVRTRDDGTTVARVFPASGLDRLMSTSAEVWMQPGVTPESLPATMATTYRQASSGGGVAVVLGAGTLTVAGLADVLHQLDLEGRVAVLKTSPVQAPLDDVVAHILAPLVEDGYVRITTGGGQVGAYLVDHPGVDAVHLTGGRATHDAIVFGIGTEGARRKAANQPRSTKPVTSELGGVGPVIVVPGPWTRRDVTTQAEKIVSMALYNAGHTCISAQVLVLPAGWPTSQALLDERVHRPDRPTARRPASANGTAAWRGTRVVEWDRDRNQREMTAMRTKHVALHVPDLERAEEFHQRVLDLAVVTREALSSGSLTDDEVWAQLPHTATWDDARLAGHEIQMVGLRRGDLLLAHFAGSPRPDGPSTRRSNAARRRRSGEPAGHDGRRW